MITIKYDIGKTPCPYNMPDYHGSYSVGSLCCMECNAFVEINEAEKYVVCNPSESNIQKMKDRVDEFLNFMSLTEKNT